MATTTQTAVVEEVEEVQKVEMYDADMARQLRNNSAIEKQQRTLLRRYIKQSVRGNQYEVSYRLGKTARQNNNTLGRLVAPIGLQCFQKDIRGALARPYYWDIDIVNSLPTILIQFCKKNGLSCPALERYVANRTEILSEIVDALGIPAWEAKQRVLSMYHGGVKDIEGLTPFVVNEMYPEARRLIQNVEKMFPIKFLEKQPNRAGKTMAWVYQTEERKCLLAIDRAMTRRGRHVDVLIHDGCLVRKKDAEGVFPAKLLKEVEADIQRDTGYVVNLAVKPLETSFERADEDPNLVPCDVIVDDVYASRAFANYMGDHLVLDGGVVWVFDERSGIWSSNETVLDRMITEAGKTLVYRQEHEGKEVVYNYSGAVSRRECLKKVLPSVLPDRTGYFRERQNSANGKLLFKDGIYDFETRFFTPEFDPEMVFHFAVPRPYPRERDEERIAYVKKVLFRDPFQNPEVGDVQLNLLARGIAGRPMKKVMVASGETNSSKGTLCKLMRHSLGELNGPFTGDSLLMRSGDQEATKALSWVKTIHNKRVAFSNEMTLNKDKVRPLNGNLLKTLASGGDEIQLRTNHKDEINIVNHALVTIFVNDLPPISPCDGAIADRIVAIPYSFSFQTGDKYEAGNPQHKLADPEIDRKLEQCLDAFLHLVIETYNSWDGKEVVLPAECKVLGESIVPVPNIRELLEEEYELTRDPNDFVLRDEVTRFLHSRGVDMSEVAIGRKLTNLGLPLDRQRVGRRREYVRTGIRRRED
jgi:hypothetical protein